VKKIYNSVTIDISTWETLEEDSFMYGGDVAECKGGGSTSTVTVDYEYNKRMAAIAEDQQAMAEKYFAAWEDYGQDYERKATEANTTLLPSQTETELSNLATQKATSEAQLSLIPSQTKAQQMALDSEISLNPLKTEAARKMLDASGQLLTSAQQGVNVGERVGEAQADVAKGFSQANSIAKRDALRSGVDTGSSEYRNMMTTANLARAKASGSAMTTAKRSADDESFNKLNTAITTARGSL